MVGSASVVRSSSIIDSARCALAMPRSAVVVLVLTFAVTGSVSISTTGSKGCECIDSATTEALGVVNGTIAFYRAEASNITWEECPKYSFYSYGNGYGLGKCAAWDSGEKPNCESNQESWCEKSWCYVNATECLTANVSFTKSSNACGRYYSYETCGYTDSFWDSGISDALKGAHIKVSIPAQYFLDVYKLDRNGSIIYYDTDIDSGVQPWHGIFIELLELLADAADFTYEFQQVSAGSQAKYDSIYTACAYDVARGVTDMCAYMWETQERRYIADFASSAYTDNYYLLVREDSGQDFLEVFRLIFEPFQWQLWLAIVGSSVAIAIAYAYIDDTILGELNERWGRKRGRFLTRTRSATISMVGVAKAKVLLGEAWFWTKVCTRYWYRSMYELTAGFTTRGEMDTAEISEGRGRLGSPGMRIVTIGWSFFIVRSTVATISL